METIEQTLCLQDDKDSSIFQDPSKLLGETSQMLTSYTFDWKYLQK